LKNLDYNELDNAICDFEQIDQVNEMVKRGPLIRDLAKIIKEKNQV